MNIFMIRLKIMEISYIINNDLQGWGLSIEIARLFYLCASNVHAAFIGVIRDFFGGIIIALEFGVSCLNVWVWFWWVND